MKKIFFVTVIFLLAQTIFAEKNNPNELAFIEAFRRSNITEMENILKQKSFQMELSAMLETIFMNFYYIDENEKNKNFYREPFNNDKRFLVPTFQLLIKYGADVNYKISYYYWLMKENADVWIDSSMQRTSNTRIFINDVKKDYSLLSDILIFKISALTNQNKLQLARLLLEAGADPNNIQWIYISENFSKPWFGDNQIALARLFIENGFNINNPLYGGSKTEEIYPLFAATISGDIGCVRLLVESGAKVNQMSFNIKINKKTAAQYAYENGEIDIYNYLKQHGATWSPPVQVANTPTPSQPTPQVSSQPSQQPRQTYNDNYDYSPPPSSSSSSSTPSRNLGKEIAEAFKSPLQSGTYSSVGTKNTLRLSAIAKSGMFSYNVQGQTGTGTYSIEGNRMTIKMLGYTLLYTVDSETSFSGGGETWVRTGY